MSSSSRFAFFDQLSSREKSLVVGLTLTVVALIVVFISFYISGEIEAVQEELDVNSELMDEIVMKAETYMSTQAQCKAVEKMLEDNPVQSLRIPVNNIARGVNLKGGRKLADEIGSLEKQTETFLGPVCQKAKEKKRRKRDEKPKRGVLRLEQDFEFRNIPIEAIYGFLNGIDKSKDLLFVTNIDVRRKFGDPASAGQATVTVATYRMTEGVQ